MSNDRENPVVADDFATTAVPQSYRRPAVELALNMSGGPICVAALFAGASLAIGLSFSQCLIAVVVGGALLALYGGAVGLIGARTGLSTGMLLANTFGPLGSRVITTAIALCLVGWYAVQTGFFGNTLHAMFPDGGVVTDSRVASVWGGLLMLSTAYFGYRGLSILSYAAVPLLLVLCFWSLQRAVGETDLWEYVPTEKGSLAVAITMVVGAFSVGATVTSDITRYAKRPAHSLATTFVAYLAVNAFMLLGGVATVVASGSPDLMQAMIRLGMGVPALLILILGQWTTNDDNLYSASLGVSGANPGINKRSVVLVSGLLATALAAAGVSDHFVPFLLLLGVGIPPLGGILIADYLCLRRGAENSRFREPDAISAFTSLAVGWAAGAFLPFGIPALNSILAAMFCFLLLRWLQSERNAAAGHASP